MCCFGTRNERRFLPRHACCPARRYHVVSSPRLQELCHCLESCRSCTAATKESRQGDDVRPAKWHRHCLVKVLLKSCCWPWGAPPLLQPTHPRRGGELAPRYCRSLPCLGPLPRSHKRLRNTFNYFYRSENYCSIVPCLSSMLFSHCFYFTLSLFLFCRLFILPPEKVHIPNINNNI